MAITAAMVKDLRERTGAGMMECKKALVAADGSIDTAIENMRKAGMAKADKKASRVAAEGLVVVAQSADNKEAVLVEINSETDFAAKDDNFTGFVRRVADVALAANPNTVEELLAAEYADGETVEIARQALISKIGENIQVRRFERINTDGVVGAYIHSGRIGVLVELQGGSSELAKDIAMHVAAINPQFVSADQVPAEILEKEKAILIAQAEDSGKPADIIEKMVAGRIRKFLAEITLMGQVFVKDSEITVEKLLQKHEASVIKYTRLAVGEGIEKKEDNFAAEVMQQVKGA
ncbi:MAG: translation elongation factor Ts [Xanthomonadales bacterium]|nr:translation elongation factor Ts [Xanthomonadales bacterium]